MMNISSSLTDPRASENQRLDIARTLSPVANAIGLARVARGALLGFAVGAVISIGILFAGHVHTFGFAVPAAVLAAVLGLLVGAGFGAARWPKTLEAARAADLYFHLDDRLTTALELKGTDTPVAFLQSRDVAHRIDGLKLAYSRGRWFHLRDGVPAGVAAVALAAALTFGLENGQHHTAAAAPATSARARHAAANRVKQLTSQLHLGLTPAQLQSPAVRRLNHALSQLRHQLLQTSTPRAALRAISGTQQQVHQLALGLHPVNGRAVAQLNSSLSRYLGKTQTRSSSAASSRSAAATANALNHLAQSLQHLTPSQRAALARALARSANATSNNALRSALRQAASSLANNAPQSAATSLRQAAQSLSQSASGQAALSRANAAATQLGALKNQIAGTGAAPPSLRPGTGKSLQNAAAAGKGTSGKNGQAPGRGTGTGKGKGKGQGQGQGQGLQPGKGRGTGRLGTRAGRGTGRGQGRAAGQGTIAAPGKGTSGARGKGGSGRSGLTRAGRSVTVYVPGKQGKGAEIVRTGPQGAPLSGSIVPYQQVVLRYSQSARQALDRAALPPSLQGDVKRYFSTLSR
jgi:hypothetical protein